MEVRRLGVIEEAEIGGEFWRAAGVLKAVNRRVSLADCFAAAPTRRLGGILLMSDHHEFDSLAQQGRLHDPTHSVARVDCAACELSIKIKTPATQFNDNGNVMASPWSSASAGNPGSR